MCVYHATSPGAWGAPAPGPHSPRGPSRSLGWVGGACFGRRDAPWLNPRLFVWPELRAARSCLAAVCVQVSSELARRWTPGVVGLRLEADQSGFPSNGKSRGDPCVAYICPPGLRPRLHACAAVDRAGLPGTRPGPVHHPPPMTCLPEAHKSPGPRGPGHNQPTTRLQPACNPPATRAHPTKTLPPTHL